MLRALVLLALVLSCPTRPATAADLDTIGQLLRTEVLTPLYGGYADAAGQLAGVQPDCAGDWRAAMRPAFVASLLAWGRLQAVGTCPAASPETSARVYFWPDKHGTATRQLGAALRDRPAKLETVAGLTGQSAGLQSLAALELLLYGDLPDEAAGFACRYAQAIADFQTELAAGMGRDFAADPTAGAALAPALLTGMQTTLDTVIQLDLDRPLGSDIAAARGERARAWRSGQSLPLVGAAIDTVEAVYTAPGGFSAAIVASAELAAFDAVLRRHLELARDAIAAVPVPLPQAVAEPAARLQVEQLKEEIASVRRLLVERLAPALGLAAGFNAMDGD